MSELEDGNSSDSSFEVVSEYDDSSSDDSLASQPAAGVEPSENSDTSFADILTFGDSLTQGFYYGGLRMHPYSTQLQVRIDSRVAELRSRSRSNSEQKCIVKEYGLSGENTSHMTNRLRFLLERDHRYKIVCILGGTNDLGRVVPDTALDVWDNLANMYDMTLVYDPHTILAAITIPQSRCMEPEYIESRSIINQEIREYCALAAADAGADQQSRNRVVLVDFEQALPYRLQHNEIDEDHWDDALHMTPQGYDALGDLIYNRLSAHIDNIINKT